MWRGETGKGEEYEVEEIPADLVEQAAEYRHQLVETVAESDEALLEKYLGGEDLTPEEIKGAIRKLTDRPTRSYPVLCGSAFKNKGVQPMLDAVVDYLPSPLDVPRRAATRVGDEETVLTRAAGLRRAVLGARLQDRLAPVLRQADLRPRLLRARLLRLAGA